jgi:hypothetical protein
MTLSLPVFRLLLQKAALDPATWEAMKVRFAIMRDIAWLAEELAVGRKGAGGGDTGGLAIAPGADTPERLMAVTPDQPSSGERAASIDTPALWTKELKQAKLNEVERLWEKIISDRSHSQLRPLVEKLRESITNVAVQGTLM